MLQGSNYQKLTIREMEMIKGSQSGKYKKKNQILTTKDRKSFWDYLWIR